MRRNDDTTGWEGRKWLESYISNEKNERKGINAVNQRVEGGIRFCSYHVSTQSSIEELRHISPQSWNVRRQILSSEIESYNADIICLQDVDHYYDYWKNKLNSLGYDSIFKQKTEILGIHLDGVCVAYKRNLFQLFKTSTIEFNDANNFNNLKDDNSDMRVRIVTDDVGVILFLQPWEVRMFNNRNDIILNND